MPENKRMWPMDILRGVALMLIIFFHASIYNFANIHKIDFSNPPIFIVIMSFMALWGGVFIIYSAVSNIIMTLRRVSEGFDRKIFLYLISVGAILIFFHYILNIFLGRWNIDFANNRPDMTFVAGSLRSLHFTFPHISKFFEGSSLSTIALNLIILSGVLFFLLKNNGVKKIFRNYLFLGISGFVIMILSFLRVPLYALFTTALENKNYLLATFFSFILANPYPLLPYLAYGFFGAMFGMMLYNRRKDLIRKIILPLGLFFVIFGLAGMFNFEKTISKPDYFWYFKTNFELGLFLLILIFTVSDLIGKSYWLNKLSAIKWFSRISLTIYLLETFVSEIMRIVLHSFLPNWDQTINGCLVFGVFNVGIWMLILYFWRRVDFKYSLEYYWVIMLKGLGKKSTKIDYLP